MLWWHWMAAALLGLLEVLAPGHIFLGFAAGSGLVALLLMGGPLAAWLSSSLAMAVLVWAVLSLLCWLALRLALGRRAKTWERDIND